MVASSRCRWFNSEPVRAALKISGSNSARAVGLAMSCSSCWKAAMEPSFCSTSGRGVVKSCPHMQKLAACCVALEASKVQQVPCSDAPSRS